MNCAANANHDAAGGSGTLMLHLLGRCNLTCLHCYMDGSPARREQLALPLVVAAIADCPRLAIGALFLTGGEPLLYRGLDEVLGAAAAVPALKVTICTNGTLIKPSDAARLRAIGAKVNVSIDGEESFHDAFRRQRGAFRASERGIRALVEAGVPVDVVTTISRENLGSLATVAAWAAAAGVAQLRVQPLLKLGRGCGIADQRLSIVQTNRLFLELTDLANRYRGRMRCTLNEVSHRFLMMHPCGAYVCNGSGCHRRVAKEIKKVVVREDGTVLPEIPNLHPRFALGNLEDGPLPVLVSRYFAAGYDRFDQLCRSTYATVMPSWECAVVPWDQIVAERSQSWEGGGGGAAEVPACGACTSAGVQA